MSLIAGPDRFWRFLSKVKKHSLSEILSRACAGVGMAVWILGVCALGIGFKATSLNDVLFNVATAIICAGFAIAFQSVPLAREKQGRGEQSWMLLGMFLSFSGAILTWLPLEKTQLKGDSLALSDVYPLMLFSLGSLSAAAPFRPALVEWMTNSNNRNWKGRSVKVVVVTLAIVTFGFIFLELGVRPPDCRGR